MAIRSNLMAQPSLRFLIAWLPKSLGLRDDFKLTPTLAKLFEDNHSIIRSTTMEKVEQALESHRSYYSRHATWEAEYDVFFIPRSVFPNQNSVPGDSLISQLESHLRFNEVDQQVRATSTNLSGITTSNGRE
ncbi:hypothetical protein Pst134EA_032617 [Puccinia striiformis f. sp. tritici]|uniref:uncharacterized protein n=1 Tax=Puccinia striiformis f. sp. tritici TaxID=168172 RepID=UPI0020083C1C|nr:uncharacterized protein Pst134EA_032617 [Puccinia striiformis f. sp. tritici]KAH9441712.1 hypothetical protein Pst134EA_032617 [Puccinia striiformis f. sp. tritici]